VTRRASRPRANPRSLPIWSCSVWGLPCPPHYCGSGALLPHLFTLTWHPLESRLEAVCFLWHFPSSGLESTLPDVIRHTALRSSDFPPPPLDAARATVRSSCQHFIIFDGTPVYGGSGRGADHANSRGDSRPRLSGRAIARLFFLQSEKCGASLRRTAGGGCPYVSPLHPFVRLDWTQVPPTTTSNARRP